MPSIFDNIHEHLLPALTQTLVVSKRADCCVGYFNLRGWKKLDTLEQWPGGEDYCCRLMVGMHRTPQDELHEVFRLGDAEDGIDNPQAICLKRKQPSKALPGLAGRCAQNQRGSAGQHRAGCTDGQDHTPQLSGRLSDRRSCAFQPS